MSFDIVIHNGLIITVNSDFDIIENGVVCITQGKLERIEARADDKPLPEAEAMIDASGWYHYARSGKYPYPSSHDIVQRACR